MVLGADGEVPVLACHQLVTRLRSLGKACFLTCYPPRAYHAGPAPSFLGNTREQINQTLSSWSEECSPCCLTTWCEVSVKSMHCAELRLGGQ